MFVEFMNLYGMKILYAIFMAVMGFIGMVVKGLATKYFNTETKRAVATTVMLAVEQMYKDIHGPEKMQKALLMAAGLLEDQGVHVTTNELKMLIEAAVCEFNANLYPEKTYAKTPLYEGPQQGETTPDDEFEEALGDLSFGAD